MDELEKNREIRIDDREAQENELQKSLDRYSVSMVKIVGIIGVITGLIILGVFWFWLLSKLF